MLDILAIIPGKKRKTPAGWIVFNGICCHRRGHNPDKRSRAGVKFTLDSNWSYSCFNCGFKCGFSLGKHFSSNLKLLLTWAGLNQDEIARLSFNSFRQASLLEQIKEQQLSFNPKFDSVTFPEELRLINDNDRIHIDYLASRGLSIDDYPFLVSDTEETRTRIVIPYFYKNEPVGYTSRYYDGRHPKYVSVQQKGYVFNIDAQRPEWNKLILVEGQFDAISIGGCGYLGSNISDEQATLLKSLDNKTIIVVPDRDKTGLGICDRALELGFQVSIPNWDSSIKDCNDAVKKYGKAATLMSILEHASSSKIITEIKRKKLL